MAHLPVVVGFGGVNSAGRTSFHHSYRRMTIDRLSPSKTEDTLTNLATMMGLVQYEEGRFVDQEGNDCPPERISARFGKQILENTLLRKIQAEHFDVDHVPVNKRMTTKTAGQSTVRLQTSRRDLPNHIPDNWRVSDHPQDPDQVEIEICGDLEFLLPDSKVLQVQTAGQLPTGFDPGARYNSRNHPRGLKMAVYGASDAIGSLGIDWETVRQLVHPDEIGVYAGSGHGQMHDEGGGGLMKAHALGKRTSSKHLPLSLLDMPSNFINAYIIGNIGHTGTQKAACATFLYNLELGMKEIRSGKRRVAIVGNSEAPLIPEIIEGYKAMSALADDTRLLTLNNATEVTHQHRATSCRPFSENCGFTLAESSQYIILFDDDLVLETGAQVFGSIGDIFIKADGYKKSISSPGFGNYLTLAKALASARAILGEKRLRQRTFMSAHGSGTPLNRTTESRGLNEIARAFGIEQWPLSAVKCYIGHPLTPAAGDQIVTALGTWEYGLIPGIFTLDHIADDVHNSNLLFSREHIEVGPEGMDAAFINSKGFGGNNATGLILSPQMTLNMITKKHGSKAISAYHKLTGPVVEKAQQYDRDTIRGLTESIYKDNERVLNDDDLDMTDRAIRIPGFDKPVSLDLSSPYPEMTLD
ncbi:beta-ketoacyl synthase [bacterium]|nr:beta-ketoacyl synthase [bacterium]